jgi:hypothetical protein
MSFPQDMVSYHDDFLGHGLLSSTQSHDAWLIADTSAAGTPVFSRGGVNGLATIGFDSQNEVQNVCLYHGDDLGFDIDLVDQIEIGLFLGQATVDSATSIAWGLASARNDDPDALAAAALFRCIGSTAIVCESDDGTTNKDDVATGKTLGQTLTKFVISFAAGKSNVKFYAGADRVAASTTFDMSAYSAGLQPFFQIQKTADTNTDSVKVDYVKIVSKRF